MLSNHITASQDTVTIDDLPSGSWFDLLVLAKNSAGMTEANYAFSTLTETGATVAPLLLNSENAYNSNSLDAIMIILPSACAVVVLVMIAFAGLYLMINKPSPSSDGLACDERGKNCSAFISNTKISHFPHNTAMSRLSNNGLYAKPNKSMNTCESLYDQNHAQLYFGTPVYGNDRPSDNNYGVHSEHVHQEAYISNQSVPPAYGFSTVEAVRFVTRKDGQSRSNHVYDVPQRLCHQDISAPLSV